MAGVAPAGSLDAGDDMGREREYNIAESAVLDWNERVIILSLDTSSSSGSAAVVHDGVLLAERVGDGARTHGERLPRELMAVLDEARVTLKDVDRFAVAIGPGSFTGLRIGIATMQGLALAQGALVTPISTFEAIAYETRAGVAAEMRYGGTERPPSIGHPPATAIGVWIDAHRGEVFATLYAPDGGVLQPPTSLSPAATLDAWQASLAGHAVRFAGDGAVRYRAIILDRLGEGAGIPAGVPPLAGAIGLIAGREPARGVRPHAVVPLYVRRPDAELARDRREAAGRG
jgi:tRNA threonylcarbamoyladenosine biosynthesis protein TsaB